MAKVVRWKGHNIVRPGFGTFFNLDGMVNPDLTSEATVFVVGEAAAGQPMELLSAPVIHRFYSSDDMIREFQTGPLAEMAKFLFDPLIAGQREQGIELKGCNEVIAIKTNLSLQASYAVKDAVANTAFTLKDRLWGALGNSTWFKIEVSGTGLKFIAGRAVAPNIGSQDSSDTGGLFSITGVDEWFSLTYTGLDAAATMTFDGTTLTTTTTPAGDPDLSITCTGKTLTQVVSEINATGGGVYTAAVLRTDRAGILATYMDRFVGVNIRGVIGKAMGVSYDMVEWINVSCDYCEATWAGGYEPQAYVAETLLAGGALGDSSTTRIDSALKIASRFNVQYLASGFGGDSVGGGVTLSTANGYFTAHAANCNSLGVPRERLVFISNDDITKAAMYATVRAFNNANVICGNNRLYREGPDEVRTWMGPHTFAAACAAAMAGSPRATPLLWKRIKAYDFDFLAADFDPTVNADFNAAQQAGVNFLEMVDGYIQVANGHTTYSAEDNDGYCNIENRDAMQWWKIIQRRYRKRMIGTKGAGSITAQQILDLTNDANEIMANTNDPDFLLVPGTDEDGNYVRAAEGFTCSMSGGTYYIRGTCRFTTGVRMILDDIVALNPTATV